MVRADRSAKHDARIPCSAWAWPRSRP